MEGGNLYKTLSKFAPHTWASNTSSLTLKMQVQNWRTMKYSMPSLYKGIPCHIILGRNYLIGGTQCKMKMHVSLFKSYEEF